jgi:hypothetical protein
LFQTSDQAPGPHAAVYVDGSAPPRQYGLEVPKSATVG